MKKLTVKEIEPQGWLKRQLEIQAAGLCGNLDRVWPDVRDSKWIGGEKEGWERVPYWLDGFIPLAYLLKDEDMIARAKRYIDKILQQQCADGWICPCTDQERKTYDMWALFLILKVLVVWYECSGDERVEESVYRALRQYRDHVRAFAPNGWAAARWYECLISVLWLYERRPEPWLLELAQILKISGTDFARAGALWKKVDKKWTMYAHVVNAAMSLKSESLYRRVINRRDVPVSDAIAERMFGLLQKYHGTAVGHFNGDECLSGTSPIHGSELCGVVEAMYSYEWLLALSGNAVWGDRLEKLAFNALPAAISPDMWTHQYDQQVNQIACTIQNEPSVFNTNSTEANVFGLEPNFGCCTANFGQGWPKFALSLFMVEGDDTLVCTAISPSSVRVRLGNVPVCVTVDTKYPFRDTVRLQVEGEGEYTLKIRIPASAKECKLDGIPVLAENGWLILRRHWSEKEQLELRFTFETKLVSRPRGMYVLERGPLVYSLPVGERWEMHEYSKDGVERKFPYCDYHIYPTEEWGYAFCGEDFKVTELPFDAAFQTNAPPVVIEADVCPIDWGSALGQPNVCRETPKSRKPIGCSVKKRFQPYGGTNLRMTEMPIVAVEN